MAKRAKPEARERLSSVATAIRLLKAFSEDEVDIGISDLARRLRIAKSTAHRLAVTLVSEGMLEQDAGTGKYRLGVALFRLGALVRRRMEVSNEARPFLYDLREKINESVHLAILDGTEIMYVYNLESTQAIRSRSDIGVRKPAYCTAEGQAILDIAVDSTNGAIYAVGYESVAGQGTNMWIRRYSSTGTVVWTRTHHHAGAGDAGADRAVSVSINGSHVVVVGDVTLALGGKEIHVRKYVK